MWGAAIGPGANEDGVGEVELSCCVETEFGVEAAAVGAGERPFVDAHENRGFAAWDRDGGIA